MKKNILLFLVVIIAFCNQLKAQNVSFEKKTASNEFKVMLIPQILSVWNLTYIDYERILAKKHSIGAIFSGTLKFKETLNDYGSFQKYATILNPYYRYYPFSKEQNTKGLFIEGNLFLAYHPFKISYEKVVKKDRFTPLEYTTEYYYEKSFKETIHQGLGFTLGNKFVTDKNFIWELIFGMGYEQNLSKKIPSRPYVKFGLILGKRF